MKGKNLVPITTRDETESGLERKWFWSAILIGVLLGLLFGQPQNHVKHEPDEPMLTRAGLSFQDYVHPP